MSTATITRLRERHSHPEITAAKIAEITELARRYQRLSRRTVHRYQAAEHLVTVLRRPMSVVTDRRRSGEARNYPLGSHYQAQAVLDGLDVVRGSWQQAFAIVRSRAARKFNDTERHEINWLLRWPEHLTSVLDGKTVIPTDKDGAPVVRFAANDHARLCRWLRSALKRHRPNQPMLRFRPTFEVDSYRVSKREGRFPVWLTVQGLTPGRPLRIPLAGSDSEYLDGTANLRVSVESDVKGRRRVVFRVAEKIEVTPRTGDQIVGIDKGITAAITATAADDQSAISLGTDYAAALKKHSDGSVRRGRSRYWSLVQNTADRQKAARIRRSNLGSVRRERAARRAQAQLRNITGRAARELVEAFPDATVFVEEALDFSTKSRSRAPGLNRRLGHWTKRRLSRDIELHVSASGARRQVVNAAYTSQACPGCRWTDSGNRKGQAFRCSHCGYAGRADAVAASNVRSRAVDETITRYTPHTEVRRLLLERHLATTDGRCPSRGCGSGLPATDHAGIAMPMAA